MSDPHFYVVGEQEILTATSIEEAMTEYLEGTYPGEVLPETVAVQGYNPKVLNPETPWLFGRGLEDLIESADDEYANPEDCGTTPTDKMKKAWGEFVKAFVEDYHVWQCEPCGDPVECNISDYNNAATEETMP